MIFKIFIGLLVLAALIYYIFCFLEIFGLIKFTSKDTEMTFPKAFIPFYYIIRKEPKKVEPEKKNPIQIINNPEDFIVEIPTDEEKEKVLPRTKEKKTEV